VVYRANVKVLQEHTEDQREDKDIRPTSSLRIKKRSNEKELNYLKKTVCRLKR
jgi:hypothetical protein